MMNRTVFVAIFALCAGLVFGCAQGSSDQDDSGEEVLETSIYAADNEPQPAPGSDLPAGAEVGDKIIIPNGRFISPAGNQVTGPRFLTDLEISPDGRYVFALSLADVKVSVFDTVSMSYIQEVPLPGVFSGMVLNEAGTKLWISGGGANDIYEFDVSGGVLTENRVIPLYGYPMGLTLSPDETILYVATSYGSKLFAVDLADGVVSGSWTCGTYPFEVALNDEGTLAYVSNWGAETLTVIDTQSDQVIDHVVVGKNPEGVIFHNGKVYVASSDEDVISVIDAATNTVTAQISLTGGDNYFGYMPTQMTLDGDDLYVSCAGYNSIAVIDTTTDTVKGHIPVGWYPTAVAVDSERGVVYVGNAKGRGHGPGGGASGQAGTLSVFDRPSSEELAAFTQEVHDNNARTANFYENLDFDSPIPTERGVPSTQIKRVIFIMKENKTYDQVFGDLSDTEADESLCVFCGDYVRNARALALRFTNCDNFFSETEASVMGHLWSTAMVCNDYNEKGHKGANVGRIAIPGIEEATQPAKGSIFEHLLDNGIPFRSYGQVMTTITNMDRLYPYVSLQYGFWNMGVSDETKIDVVIRDMEAGIWPPLVYISLPNDHGQGGADWPTIGYYVADNDAALGKLVDYVSHSEYWDETAIFVTQDDPQSGADHIDAHRTIGLVISPWARRGYTSSTFYSMSSMWLTIQLILGLPSLTHYDKNVAPMYDCFTMTPDNTPFDALPRVIPLEYNTKGPLDDWASRQIWDVPDQIPDMGRYIWSVMRPGEEFPFHLSVDIGAEEIRRERAEGLEYRRRVEAWAEFAKKKGIAPLETNLRRVVERP